MVVRWPKFLFVLCALWSFSGFRASAQRLQHVEQLVVLDADGKRVGPAIGAEHVVGQFVPLVPFRVGQVPFILGVYRDGFAPVVTTSPTTVLWESEDCSGTPFLQAHGFPTARSLGAMPLIAVGLPGNTVYVEDGPGRTIRVRSISTPSVEALLGSPELRSQCNRSGWPVGLEGLAIPARALINLDTRFRAPFTVR